MHFKLDESRFFFFGQVWNFRAWKKRKNLLLFHFPRFYFTRLIYFSKNASRDGVFVFFNIFNRISFFFQTKIKFLFFIIPALISLPNKEPFKTWIVILYIQGISYWVHVYNHNLKHWSLSIAKVTAGYQNGHITPSSAAGTCIPPKSFGFCATWEIWRHDISGAFVVSLDFLPLVGNLVSELLRDMTSHQSGI